MIGFQRCREFEISGKLKTLSALNPRRHQRGGFFAALAPTPTSTVTESVVGLLQRGSRAKPAEVKAQRCHVGEFAGGTFATFQHFSRHQIQDAGRNYGTGDAPRWGSR